MSTSPMIEKQILKILLDENTLKIINQLNSPQGNEGSILITKTNLTRKQFYYTLNELTRFGIIKKDKGKYHITTLGKIVWDITTEYKLKLNEVVQEYWKFKAIDLLDIADELTNDERDKIIGKLFNESKSEYEPSPRREIQYKQYISNSVK